MLNNYYSYFYFNKHSYGHEYPPTCAFTEISYQKMGNKFEKNVRKHASIVKAEYGSIIWLMKGGNVLTTSPRNQWTSTVKIIHETKKGLEGILKKLDLGYDKSKIIPPCKD